jgi:hypothetical protein
LRRTEVRYSKLTAAEKKAHPKKFYKCPYCGNFNFERGTPSFEEDGEVFVNCTCYTAPTAPGSG